MGLGRQDVDQLQVTFLPFLCPLEFFRLAQHIPEGRRDLGVAPSFPVVKSKLGVEREILQQFSRFLHLVRPARLENVVDLIRAGGHPAG